MEFLKIMFVLLVIISRINALYLPTCDNLDDATGEEDEAEYDASSPNDLEQLCVNLGLGSQRSLPETIQILKQASSIAEAVQAGETVNVRRENDAARRLLSFINGNYWTRIEDLQSGDFMTCPVAGSSSSDPEWTIEPLDNTRRRTKNNTARLIVEMADRGDSVKKITDKYPWYRPKHLKKLRAQLNDTLPSALQQQVNDHTVAMLREGKEGLSEAT